MHVLIGFVIGWLIGKIVLGTLLVTARGLIVVLRLMGQCLTRVVRWGRQRVRNR